MKRINLLIPTPLRELKTIHMSAVAPLCGAATPILMVPGAPGANVIHPGGSSPTTKNDQDGIPVGGRKRPSDIRRLQLVTL